MSRSPAIYARLSCPEGPDIQHLSEAIVLRFKWTKISSVLDRFGGARKGEKMMISRKSGTSEKIRGIEKFWKNMTKKNGTFEKLGVPKNIGKNDDI